MGYLIRYDPENDHKYIAVGQRKFKPVLAWICVFVILLGIVAAFSEPIRKALIPGNPEVTSVAFECLVTDIQEGESIGDSVTTFCQRIIMNDDAT